MDFNRYEEDQEYAKAQIEKFNAAWDKVRQGVWANNHIELSLKTEEQEGQWGSPVYAHDMKTWAGIIGMEYGKLCKAMLRFNGDGDREKFMQQLVDIAGVAMSALHGMTMEEIDEAAKRDES